MAVAAQEGDATGSHGRHNRWISLRPPFPPGARLPALAWANVSMHVCGLALAWYGMRPGSVAAHLTERMAYLAGRPAGWTWGWGVWMICTLLLVSFMAALRSRVPGPSLGADLALVFTAAGMGADLLCDVIQIQALPLVAAAGSGQVPLFLALERIAFTGGATVANGLYTAGILLMVFCLRPVTSVTARLAGIATGIAGAVMVVAGLLPSPALLVASTGPTIGFYSLWTVLMARDLRQDRP
ncbi:MAG TPA: hypothetical protein VF173_38415 [Thermoanaerobaculia bacterium]|nr:hypothetical protein [Thermoanaerobaculia bacterium]